MRLFVGIPCYQSMPVQFAHCLFSLQLPCEHMELHMIAGNPFLSLARAILAERFLRTDCSHLLFIDSDIIFDSEQLARITSHDLDIVGGIYAKKQREVEWVYNSLPDKTVQPDENGLLRLDKIGPGFLLIKRGVFERMIEVYGKEIGFKHDEDGRQMWEFFSIGVHRPSNRWFSEDWWFCQRARDMGYDVYGDTKCVVGHLGTVEFPLK
jgi:hypothetical protein